MQEKASKNEAKLSKQNKTKEREKQKPQQMDMEGVEEAKKGRFLLTWNNGL